MRPIQEGGRAGRLSDADYKQELAAYGRIRSDAEVKMERSQLEMKRVGQMLASTPDGKLLVEMLENAYYRGDIRGADPHDSYFNLGRRDVVDFLLGLRDQAKKEK